MKNFPVQNANEQINTNVETVESIREFLQTKPKSKIVVAILSDAIIFARLSSKMSDILNIFDPKNSGFEFELQDNYSGSNTAIDVLKIKDTELENILGQIYFDLVYMDNEMTQKADEVAELVYFRWIKAIKKYNSSYN
jgi:hypothetical protein